MRTQGRKLGLLFLAGLFAAGLVASVTTVATSTPESIVVTSTVDSGPGTLRQALVDAENGDTITFDTTVFPPSAPATIYVNSELPSINQGNLTIDATNAGVILDGSNVPEEAWTSGLQIDSNGNVIRGLQIVNFSGNGIELRGQNNTIGGSRELGSGSLGQGNLLSGNQGRGVALLDAGTSFNTIVGNYIGTNVKGTAAWANWNGIHISGASYNDVIDNLVSGNSGYGIELCCTSDTTSNEISSNYVGTDASGAAALGNGSSGISVHDGASHNMIGPDNVIAYNTEDGIAVFSPDSMGNTIAQNSIHDNGGLGIHLFDGGNAELAAPIIFDFDLGAGTVMGATCANCTVEVFSDSADEGGVYEGRITADGLGAFTFGNGASFAGPHLTVTAIDANGNTSELSAPTSGTRRSLILQEGNNLPKAQLRPKPSSELADNRIGVIMSNMLPISDAQGIVAGLTSLRVKRIKWTLNEAEVESNLGGTLVGIDWSEPELYVPPDPGGPDDFATGLANNGIISTYLLNFWDKANHPGGWEPVGSRFKTEEEIQRYLDYVRFIVHHFKDRIQYYEIWNEPDMGCPLQCIEVADYINLVRRTVPVIRQEYPAAKVVVGSIVLQNSDSRDWLFSLLASDVMPLVDVVSWHPMFGVSPEHNSQYYYEYPSLVQEIKAVASAHDFKGEYRGDELLWRSPDCFWCYPGDPLDSNIVAAKNYARGIVMHLGMGVTAGTGGLSDLRRESFYAVQDLCTIMAGAEAATAPVDIQSAATNIKSYSFSMPGGDKLVALWTDGVAVDDDPGVEATLTFAGFSDMNVMGIDVLNGFEQPLLTDTEDGNLVIRNLLVKDYPVILRLRPGVTTSLAQGWNHVCYVESEQPIEEALSPFIEHVAAAYALRPDHTYDRWFPGRPDVSTIITVSPYKPLLLLMTDGATWNQELAGSPPTSASLVQGWNSVCYLGQTKSVSDATATIASQLGILYALRSDQTWSRYVPERPDMTNITQLAQYDAVLLLMNAEGGGQWVFNP